MDRLEEKKVLKILFVFILVEFGFEVCFWDYL